MMEIEREGPGEELKERGERERERERGDWRF